MRAYTYVAYVRAIWRPVAMGCTMQLSRSARPHATTVRRIDAAVGQLVDKVFKHAVQLLTDRRPVLEAGAEQLLAREMGAVWVGGADAVPPVKLRAAIPPLNYQAHLFQERSLRSVTANTRADGEKLLRLAAEIPLQASTEEFPLEQANEALFRLRHDQIAGAAVLRIRERPEQYSIQRSWLI